MDGQSKECPTKPRREPISGIAACRDGVGRVQIANRAPSQASDRHRHATECRQFQQRAATGVVALSIRGSGVDVQEHHKTRLGRATRAWAYLLYETRQLSQNHQLVCHHMGTAPSPSRHGLQRSIVAARRVRPVAKTKYASLPQNRTYEYPHRPQNRTRCCIHRPRNRSYVSQICICLGPKTVHLLDMPSVRAFAGELSKGVNRHRWLFWLTNSGAKL